MHANTLDEDQFINRSEGRKRRDERDLPDGRKKNEADIEEERVH